MGLPVALAKRKTFPARCSDCHYSNRALEDAAALGIRPHLRQLQAHEKLPVCCWPMLIVDRKGRGDKVVSNSLPLKPALSYREATARLLPSGPGEEANGQ